MLRTGRGVSIEHRLPLLISLLLIAVIATLAVSAVREARRLAINAARTRLVDVTTQLATSNAEGYRTRLAQLATAGRNDTIARYVLTRDRALAAGASRILARLVADTVQVIGAVITDSAGGGVLAAGHESAMASLGAPDLHSDTAKTGFLVANDSLIGFATTAPVRAGGRTVGHLVQWRRLTTSPRARKVIADFVGNDAAIYFGNPSGDLWVDLAGTRVEAPPEAIRSAGTSEYDRPGAGRQLVSIQTMAGTPWMVDVEFPRAAFLSSEKQFVRRLVLISALLVVAGVALSWVASRHIARPLVELTGAAEAIAGGDFSVPVQDKGRDDEVGRLARSFASMAERVQATHRELEDRVARRTDELRATVQTLHDTQGELLRKERLALLGQLSSSVGHELRNPLGVMSNAVYYLDAVLPNSETNVREYLGILRTQIATSEKIVSDLLDFARVRQPERRTIPVEKIVAAEVGSQSAPENVTVQTQFSPDVPAIFADPVHVGQILRNLASNAIQAMEQSGGTLTVRSMTDGPGNVRIEVSDTGSGIAPENTAKVFEPLFTTKARGIGLGLAVSRSLAVANGGTLTFSSRPGEGTTFVLTLPAPQESAS